MEKIRLGRTGLMVTKTGFGALPIQRVSFEDAERILKMAYDGGVNFFDTARAYSDSEEKIGRALSGVRSHIILATKTMAKDKDSMFRDLHTSLKLLKTDYIDIYQLHNPAQLPDPNEQGGLYEGLLEAKRQGKIRHISITQHSLSLAKQAARSGLYDTVQFPLSSVSSEEDISLISLCKDLDVGVIAMKAMAGGLITQAAASFAFLRQFDNVVPIWGVQREKELEEFLSLEKDPPSLSELMPQIERDRKELAGTFCRGCGYCMPCPKGIDIPTSARMSLLLRRAPAQNFLTQEWQRKMALIDECIHCGQCKSKCPYKLDTPALLQANREDYKTFLPNTEA